MSGSVVLDDLADREPDYWMWHLSPKMDAFDYWLDIQMTQPQGQVRWVVFMLIMQLTSIAIQNLRIPIALNIFQVYF